MKKLMTYYYDYTQGDEGKVVRYSEFLAYAIIRRKRTI